MSITTIRLIAEREIRARWALCPGALVFGILAMMVTRTLDVDDGGPADMLLIARIIGFLAAAMIGLSLLGDQLTDGRLSFYFSRPFTPRAIFVGKLVGGVALAVAIDLCLVGPVVLGFPDPATGDAALARAWLVQPRLIVTMPEMMLGVAAAVVFGMAAGIAVRSRSRWLVLDILGVGSLLVMIAFMAVHIQTTAMEIWNWPWDTLAEQRAAPGVYSRYLANVSVVAMVFVAAILVTIVYATARALARGRIDREIAHTTLSKTLWPIVVPLGAAAVVAVVTWL